MRAAVPDDDGHGVVANGELPHVKPDFEDPSPIEDSLPAKPTCVEDFMSRECSQLWEAKHFPNSLEKQGNYTACL